MHATKSDKNFGAINITLTVESVGEIHIRVFFHQERPIEFGRSNWGVAVLLRNSIISVPWLVVTKALHRKINAGFRLWEAGRGGGGATPIDSRKTHDDPLHPKSCTR